MVVCGDFNDTPDSAPLQPILTVPHLQALTAAGVERRGLFGVDTFSGGTIQPFPTVTGKKASASDHGAVWASVAL